MKYQGTRINLDVTLGVFEAAASFSVMARCVQRKINQ